MGARMVDFGGWDMPLHYGSQIEERHHVRRDCGMFEGSHMLIIDVRGVGGRALLSCARGSSSRRSCATATDSFSNRQHGTTIVSG